MLKNFQVIEVISSKTKAQMTFYTNKLKFNVFTAPDLGFSAYVKFLSDANGKCFAVQACEKEDENAIPFSRDKDAKPYPIVIRSKAIIDAISSMMDWRDDCSYYIVPGQRFPDERAIVFNMKDAEKFTITQRGGQSDGDKGADGEDNESSEN